MGRGNTWTISKLPLYGALTGIELSGDTFEVTRGIVLRRVYVDVFGAPMMAFGPPSSPNSHHPAPWVAVRGGFGFSCRVEVAITDLSEFETLSPSTVAWLIAAVLRLQLCSPVRMAVLGNMPFDQMGAGASNDVTALSFEGAPHQICLRAAGEDKRSAEDLDWLRSSLPVAAHLYHDERFLRAFSVYEHAQWSPTLEMAVVLIWSAMEIFFDLGRNREKTKAISSALAGFVGDDGPDKDHAYQAVRDLYQKRGRVVHAGQTIDPASAAQTIRLARATFRKALLDRRLPATDD